MGCLIERILETDLREFREKLSTAHFLKIFETKFLGRVLTVLSRDKVSMGIRLKHITILLVKSDILGEISYINCHNLDYSFV